MNPFYTLVADRAAHRCEYCHAPELVFNWASRFGIVQAIANLEVAEYTIKNQFVILNQWHY